MDFHRDIEVKPYKSWAGTIPANAFLARLVDLYRVVSPRKLSQGFQGFQGLLYDSPLIHIFHVPIIKTKNRVVSERR